MNGPRPAPISFTYLDLIAASVGPGILNWLIEGSRKERAWSGTEGNDRCDDSYYMYMHLERSMTFLTLNPKRLKA